MNKLDELINQLCPDGVEYARLEDYCDFEKGKTPIQKAIPGEYPLVVTTSARKTSDSYQFDGPAVCVPLISSRGHGVASLNEVYYQDGKFALGNILCGITSKDEGVLSARFLTYYLNFKKDILIVPLMRGGANVSLSIDSLKKIRIPILPIAVQKEICKNLSVFFDYIDSLKAELKQRIEQFEYYKSFLFLIDKSVPVVTTKDISKERFWLMPATPKYVSEGVPYITSKNIKNGKIIFDDIKYISKEDFDEISKNRRVQKNDLLITMIGTIGESAFVDDEKEFYGQNLYVVRIDESKCLRKYFYYFLSMKAIKEKLVAKKNTSSQGYIKAGSIDNLMLPLPSISEQRKLIDYLECFDSLCYSDTNGISAEISMRLKQLDYYQGRFFNFKEMTIS